MQASKFIKLSLNFVFSISLSVGSWRSSLIWVASLALSRSSRSPWSSAKAASRSPTLESYLFFCLFLPFCFGVLYLLPAIFLHFCNLVFGRSLVSGVTRAAARISGSLAGQGGLEMQIKGGWLFVLALEDTVGGLEDTLGWLEDTVEGADDAVVGPE